ncbi:neprilysin-1-like isoform X2 [Mercenaria mercenaria]|uniref:neprilysin-1-like isoform X2 n=1 Tax=Mercenaria mercenaria TaxID=6596 RepID=UPI00234EA6FA|nr:neprilysin-1-like isoform X2 [Mercenaria mercenaria]
MGDDVKFRNGYKAYIRRPLWIIAGFVILLLLIIIIILAALLARKSGDTKQTTEKVCEDEHCIKTASRLLGAMRTEIDPCDNFYEFACGQWVDKHRVPEDKGSIDTMEEVSDRLERDLQDLLESPADNDIEPIRKAKTFYKACMDTESINAQGHQDMLKFISNLGGWPVLDKAWQGSTFDLEESIANARQYTTNFVWPIPHGIMMGLNILNDYKVYGKHVLYLDQPSLLMEGRDMYQNDQLINAYVKYTTDVAIALGAESDVATTQMKELVDFEKEIAQITVAISDRRDMDGNYRRMNVSSLSDLYPKFDWLRYLKATFRDTPVTIDDNEPVVLWMKPYYDQLFPLLEKTPNRTIANYIVWRLITKQFITLEEQFSLMKLQFRKNTEGVKQLKPRGLRCSESTNHYLDHATGRMYAEKIFGPKERDHMLELISYLRRIFKGIVNTADWMDDVTKQEALKKLEAMKSLIGFPSFIFNDTVLTETYSNVTVSPTNFFENLRSIRRYVGLKQLAELRQPSYERWPERPAIVNAFYHSGLNAIVFPAGILQSPYYDINYPSSINFGGIGLVIGHEITHGYDASGRAFDAKGLLHNWWSNYSLQNYNEKAACVINHYSEFKVPKINMNINGNTTLSENIADIGGIKQSHLAYKLWLKENNNKDKQLPGLSKYSDEQLFFINTAQLWCSKFTDEAARRSVLTSVHSLPMYRVLGELRNSQGFSEAFNCPVGSYMNPDQPKCSLW